MTIMNALSGLVADAIDRLAERVSSTGTHQQATRQQAVDFIRSPARGEGRELIAKMARAEVKNYLAGLAEQAEVPFDDPVSLLRNIAGRHEK